MEKIVTTLLTHPGKKVVEVKGVVSAYDTAFRAVRMISDMDEYIEKAMDNLYKKAIKLGANAVLGVQMSILNEYNNPILIGTAVVLEDE
jgi:uncharacterized protein YbjQ (UPF0145 family)